MSRMIVACCALSIATAAADETLLPTPDPISTASAVPCLDELNALDEAQSELADAAATLALAEADADIAEALLEDCLCGAGDCSVEQTAFDIASALVETAQNQFEAMSTARDDAEAAYNECMCNGPGPPPPGSGDPPAAIAQIFAINRGLASLVEFLTS